MLLVSDEEIRRSQEALWSGARVVVEPGGAAAFGAVLAGKYVPADGERHGLDLHELGAGAYPEFLTHTEEFLPR